MTAKAWGGKTPSEWDSLSSDDKAEMMALVWAEGIMQQMDSLTKEELIAMRFESAKPEQSDG